MQGSVRKKGDTWYYSFELASVKGKRKRVERKGGPTKKEALKALRAAISDYESRGRVMGQDGGSVADYMDYWLENYVKSNLRYNSHRTYLMMIDNHIKPMIGKYRLSAVTPALVQELLNDCKTQMSKNSLAILRSVLNLSFKMAVYPYQYLKDSPMQYVSMPRYKKPQQDHVKTISIEQFYQIIRTFPEDSPYRIPYLLSFHTGLRLGETLGLLWEDVDFKKNVLHINHNIVMEDGVLTVGPTKNVASTADVKISTELSDILKKERVNQSKYKLQYGEYYTQPEYNFVCRRENGNSLYPHNISRSAKSVAKKLGLDFSFHSLRHTHATLLLESGVPITAIQKRLRHASLQTTISTYLHSSEAMDNEIISAIENFSDVKTPPSEKCRK
jgi:integrase